MARIGQKIQLSMEERQELLTMSRSHKLEKRYVERAMIILHSADDRSFDQIIELTGKSRPLLINGETVFVNTGLKALKMPSVAVNQRL